MMSVVALCVSFLDLSKGDGVVLCEIFADSMMIAYRCGDRTMIGGMGNCVLGLCGYWTNCWCSDEKETVNLLFANEKNQGLVMVYGKRGGDNPGWFLVMGCIMQNESDECRKMSGKLEYRTRPSNIPTLKDEGLPFMLAFCSSCNSFSSNEALLPFLCGIGHQALAVIVIEMKTVSYLLSKTPLPIAKPPLRVVLSLTTDHVKLGLWASVETGFMGQAKLGLWASVEAGLMGQAKLGLWASKPGLWASVETGLMGQAKLGLWARRNWAYGPKPGLWASVETGLMGQCRNWAYGPGETGLMGQAKLGSWCRNWAYGPIWKLGLWTSVETGLMGQAKLGLWANMEIGLMGQCRNWAYEILKLPHETGLLKCLKLPAGTSTGALQSSKEIGLEFGFMENRMTISNGIHKAAPVSRLWVAGF
ncbi:hypothetical protein V8G54_011528 [Vigna mungo]|uniref:Uncharacterized protein n=1 Tax=Vigna mungo TaxID=3915 RepID=A0AAQ3NRS5_VIGMU